MTAVAQVMTARECHPNGAVSTFPASLECDGTPTRVRFEITSRAGAVRWTFPRSVLDEGLTGPAGAEDVRVWLDSPWHIGVEVPDDADGTVTYWLPLASVQRFVDRALGDEWGELNRAVS